MSKVQRDLSERRFLAATVLTAAMLMGLVASGCSGPEADVAEAAVVTHGGSALRFTDATESAGLGDFRHVTGAFGKKWFPESMGSGGGVIDYDGDGWIDILIVGGGSWPESAERAEHTVWLYRNNGDGTFTLVTDEAGLGDVDAYGIGLAVADYNNDGHQDFYLTTLTENLLFRNDGGVFTEVGRQAGVAGEPAWSASAIFFDADKDGQLDLYVGNYVEWSPETDIFCSLDGETKGYCTPETYRGVPGRFYRNNGDGTFADRTAEAGFLPSPGKMLGVAEYDFNRDGWPDLFVANDTQPDQLYVNNGDGTFTERGAVSGIAYDENGKARAGMGIDVGVVDDTGEAAVFVGNFSKEMIGVYRHMGNGLFLDRAALSKIGRPSLMTLTFGLFLIDADLDGDLDLFTANGHVQPEVERTQEGITYPEPPHLFANNGDGTFHDIAPEIGGVFTRPVVGRGAAFADIDRDGDVDLLVFENNGPAHLWLSELNPRDPASEVRSLRLAVEGRESNRSGLGAHVEAVVGERRMEQRIRSGSSYLSASEHVATFGVGSADHVDSLIVRWPSGRLEAFADVEANREWLLIEGSGELVPSVPAGAARLAVRQ